MKRVEAVFRLEKLGEVKEVLACVGHAGMTVMQVKGHGLQRGITQQWRGQNHCIDLLSKVRVSVVVNDHDAQDVVEAIMSVARTGMIGDGKIFVSPVETAYRIRTGESGPEAI